MEVQFWLGMITVNKILNFAVAQFHCFQLYQSLVLLFIFPLIMSFSTYLYLFSFCCVCLRIVGANTYCVVFLFCLSLSCVLCSQCFQCLQVVCLRHVSCVPNVANVSRLFVFVMCLVYPMFPMSLGCLSSSCVLYTQCSQCLQVLCLRPVSCVPNVVSFSGLSILDFPFGFL